MTSDTVTSANRFRAQTRLPADPTAPARARAFVHAEIKAPQVRAGTSLDDIVLVVSELVTNAVQAGSSSIDLVLDADDRVLELVVEDDAAGFPTPGRPTPDALGGRGLGIVADLTDSWATTMAEGRRGKRVIARWNVLDSA